MSIAYTRGKWRTREGLQDILDHHANEVFIEGIVVRDGDKFSGYAHSIPYGETIRVRSGKDTYGFKKRTNGSIEVS